MADGRVLRRLVRTVGMIVSTLGLLLIVGFLWNGVVVEWQHWCFRQRNLALCLAKT